MMRRQPWPISSGTAQSGTTEVALDGRGAVAWSVPIPTRMASELVADADGRWFLRTPDLIAAGRSARDPLAVGRLGPGAVPARRRQSRGAAA